MKNSTLYIFNFSKCQFDDNGQMKKFSKVSTNWKTFFEKLTKTRDGFSFDKSCNLISYIDSAMREEHGAPEDNVWTRQKLRDLKDRIIREIEAKLEQG